MKERNTDVDSSSIIMSMVNANRLVEALKIHDALMNRADEILDKHGVKHENICFVTTSKDCKKIDIGYESRYMPAHPCFTGLIVKHQEFSIEEAVKLLNEIED